MTTMPPNVGTVHAQTVGSKKKQKMNKEDNIELEKKKSSLSLRNSVITIILTGLFSISAVYFGHYLTHQSVQPVNQEKKEKKKSKK